MIAPLKKLGLIVFVAAGIGLFVLKKTGTVPSATLFKYIGIWIAYGVGGTVLLSVLDRNLAAKRKPETKAPKPQAPRPMQQPLPPEDDPHSGPAVVLARAERRPGFDVTRDGTSWFGGLPALGQVAWPLDATGQPMTPLAQIDLTGLSKTLRVPGLPETGSLCFFAALSETARWVGLVVHVAQTSTAVSQPPGPLPPVLNHSFGGPLRRGEPGEDQRLYPRMAMQLVPVAVSSAADPAAFDAQVQATLGPDREERLGVGQFKTVFPDKNRPFNRDSLLRFLRSLRTGLGSSAAAEKKLREGHVTIASVVKRLTGNPLRSAEENEQLAKAQKTLKRLDDIFRDYGAAFRKMGEDIESLDAWARTGNRWQMLTDAEQEMLAPLLAPLTVQSGLAWAHLTETIGVHRYPEDSVDETLLVMAVAEDAVFNALPEPVRVAINGPWRQPRDRQRHQMFGEPSNIQQAADDNADAYLLLQLQCDDIAGFHWGDAGVLQYWIRPDDLAGGRWDRVQMTFEGH